MDKKYIDYYQDKIDRKDKIALRRKSKNNKHKDSTKWVGWKIRAELQLKGLSKSYINLMKKKK